MQPTRDSVARAGALGLPPRDSALKAFAGLSDTASRAFLKGLLVALWDAEKKDDLGPVQQCIAAWYTDTQFDDLGESTTSGSGTQLTHEEMLGRLGLR